MIRGAGANISVSRWNESRSVFVCLVQALPGLFKHFERERMFNLIQFAQRWLWPAAVEVSEQTQDSSSMADLVRLLETDVEASAPVNAPATDAGDSSAS